MNVIDFPAPKLEVSEIKAVAAFALWQTGRFDTHDIAQALSLPESQIVRMLDLFRKVAAE